MTTPDYHLEPSEAPDWAFSPEQDLHCPLPDCNAALSGLNWKMSEPVTELIADGIELTPGPVMTAMILIPCGHELPTDVWELSFSGRDRKFGTVIRAPKFQRLDGS